MPDKFIGKSQPPLVEHPGIVDDHGIIQRPSPGESSGLQDFVLPQKPEGPGPANLSFEVPVGDLDEVELVGNEGMAEIDGVGQLEIIARQKRRLPVSIGDGHRMADDDEFLRPLLSSNSGLF